MTKASSVAACTNGRAAFHRVRELQRCAEASVIVSRSVTAVTGSAVAEPKLGVPLGVYPRQHGTDDWNVCVGQDVERVLDGVLRRAQPTDEEDAGVSVP